jgi:hypothetical protein
MDQHHTQNTQDLAQLLLGMTFRELDELACDFLNIAQAQVPDNLDVEFDVRETMLGLVDWAEENANTPEPELHPVTGTAPGMDRIEDIEAELERELSRPIGMIKHTQLTTVRNWFEDFRKRNPADLEKEGNPNG